MAAKKRRPEKKLTGIVIMHPFSELDPQEQVIRGMMMLAFIDYVLRPSTSKNEQQAA